MWEGEELPQLDPDDVMATHIHAMLANGMGGLDWVALPLAVVLFGVRDVELMIRRLLVLKLYQPPKEK